MGIDIGIYYVILLGESKPPDTIYLPLLNLYNKSECKIALQFKCLYIYNMSFIGDVKVNLLMRLHT